MPPVPQPTWSMKYPRMSRSSTLNTRGVMNFKPEDFEAGAGSGIEMQTSHAHQGGGDAGAALVQDLGHLGAKAETNHTRPFSGLTAGKPPLTLQCKTYNKDGSVKGVETCPPDVQYCHRRITYVTDKDQQYYVKGQHDHVKSFEVVGGCDGVVGAQRSVEGMNYHWFNQEETLHKDEGLQPDCSKAVQHAGFHGLHPVVFLRQFTLGQSPLEFWNGFKVFQFYKEELSVGAAVKTHGLKKATHRNGKSGILQDFDDDKQRWRVQYDEDDTFGLLKPENIALQDPQPVRMSELQNSPRSDGLKKIEGSDDRWDSADVWGYYVVKEESKEKVTTEQYMKGDQMEAADVDAKFLLYEFKTDPEAGQVFVLHFYETPDAEQMVGYTLPLRYLNDFTRQLIRVTKEEVRKLEGGIPYCYFRGTPSTDHQCSYMQDFDATYTGEEWKEEIARFTPIHGYTPYSCFNGGVKWDS
eukprot:gnl/MRDRNA2_/MRDRNA2_41340_c0_seq2.p1 gnl/MRDRNA2_/MRDRNA2_41340_c0~~gnl/MRDRNA2_/MRDRNA2_41340_c0_seq2.p1  ORF type:complete len:527 (+),score=73.77 gnl/MRDRNA2_/MRDRNA2_41340_c0_seq2:181-1581(+)